MAFLSYEVSLILVNFLVKKGAALVLDVGHCLVWVVSATANCWVLLLLLLALPTALHLFLLLQNDMLRNLGVNLCEMDAVSPDLWPPHDLGPPLDLIHQLLRAHRDRLLAYVVEQLAAALQLILHELLSQFVKRVHYVEGQVLIVSQQGIYDGDYEEVHED